MDLFCMCTWIQMEGDDCEVRKSVRGMIFEQRSQTWEIYMPIETI